MTLQQSLFGEIVGQEAAKRKLTFYLESYPQTRMVPNLMFVAPKGNGKTTLAREMAKGLYKFDQDGAIEIKPETGKPRKKTFIEVNCSTLKSVKQFINGLVIPYLQDKDVTVLFDEASELPRDVTMALLTILNPNPTNQNSFSFDDYTCDFDFKRQTFLFATSEAQRVFHALLDRLNRIDLEEYTPEHLAAIVQKGAKEVDFQDKVLFDIASVLRGNARAAQKMAGDILLYLRNRKQFGKPDWKSLRDTLGILPLGINTVELSILRYLCQNAEGTSLTCLSAKTGLSRECLQRDYELFLQRLNLMEIATTGRRITAQGLDYLKRLDGKTE